MALSRYGSDAICARSHHLPMGPGTKPGRSARPTVASSLATRSNPTVGFLSGLAVVLAALLVLHLPFPPLALLVSSNSIIPPE